jgi:hypothetical protein
MVAVLGGGGRLRSPGDRAAGCIVRRAGDGDAKRFCLLPDFEKRHSNRAIAEMRDLGSMGRASAALPRRAGS